MVDFLIKFIGRDFIKVIAVLVAIFVAYMWRIFFGLGLFFIVGTVCKWVWKLFH